MGAFDKLNAVEAAEPSGDFGLIPAGVYHLEVLEATEDTNANGKDFINLKSVIHGPSYAGRYLWQRLWCTTEKATAISKSQLLAIAGNKDVVGDIRGKHYTAEVFVEPGNPKNDGSGENWPDQNRQRRFKAYDGSAPAPAEEAKGDEWSDF